MADASDGRDPFLHLKESLGSLMFLWCRLDEALSDALEGCGSPAPRAAQASFHERLARLRDRGVDLDGADPARAASIRGLVERLDAVRRRRNLIVHSLSGLSADPAKGEPHLTCRDDERDPRSSVRITQTALSALLREMDRCAGELGSLRHTCRQASSATVRRTVRGRS